MQPTYCKLFLRFVKLKLKKKKQHVFAQCTMQPNPIVNTSHFYFHHF